jgi:hypothetical protein
MLAKNSAQPPVTTTEPRPKGAPAAVIVRRWSSFTGTGSLRHCLRRIQGITISAALAVAGLWLSLSVVKVTRSNPAPATKPAACEPWVRVDVDETGRSVFDRHDPPYTGEDAFDVVVFKDHLYLGIEAGITQPNPSQANVWRTAGGPSPIILTEVVSDAFDDPGNDHIDSLAVFGGAVYASTYHVGGDGFQLWRSESGDPGTWQRILVFGPEESPAPGSKNFKDLIVFDGYLCGFTGNPLTGSEAWCSTTGESGEWERKNEGGFGSGGDNNLARSTGVFSDALYAGVRNWVGGGELWRAFDLTAAEPLWTQVISQGFGKGAAFSHVDVAGVFDGALYVAVARADNGVEGAAILQSTDGLTFRQVVTPANTFNGRLPADGWAVYHNRLYVSFSDSRLPEEKEGGFQIWQTENGADWSAAMSDGFGDPYNAYAQLAVFDGYLWAWTANYFTGQQLWRMRCRQESKLYLPLIAAK